MKRFLLSIILSISGFFFSQNCLPPTDAITVDTTPFTATLTWSSQGPATMWDIYVVPVGAPWPTETSNPTFFATTFPFVATNLEPNVCYEFYVRSRCDNVVSPWIASEPFCTQSTSLCGGIFTDNGGADGDYQPNSSEVTTICPENPGDVVTVTFTSFDTEATWDGLYVYNGNSSTNNMFPSSNGPGNGQLGLPGAYWGNTIPGPFTSTSPDGCLTFHFISNGETNLSGWTANVSCGPMENALELIAFLDLNNNGTQDEGENGFPYGQFHLETVGGSEINPYFYANSSVFFVADPAFMYNASFTVDGGFTTYFASNQSYTNVATSGVTQLLFPVTATTPFNNVSVTLVPYGPAVAGFGVTLLLHLQNTGNTAMSGTANFTANPTFTLNATNPETSISGNSFSYDYDLAPFETAQIQIFLTVPTIPTVSVGQVVNHTASVSVADDVTADNSFTLSQVILASYDPNDITESHGPQIQIDDFMADDYLYYTIRFQNTGNFPAANVHLENTLDAQIDAESFRLVAASHDYQAERSGNQLTFRFNDINLPFEDDNEPASHGFVTYKVKLNPGFEVGDIVPNTAEIYFDFNPAIITNTFETEFIEPLGVADSNAASVGLYPNPAKQFVSVISSSEIQKITITDLLGKTIIASAGNASQQQSVELSALSKGIYLVQVTTANGTSVKKLIVN